MSEHLSPFAELADRLFADLAAHSSAAFPERWQAVADAGMVQLLVPEAAGGVGGTWRDAVAIARLAGRHALPLPVVEAILAAALLDGAGLAPPAGLTVIAPVAEGSVREGRFTGRLSGVPWGREAASCVAMVEGRLFCLAAVEATLTQRENPAGEPRDSMDFAGAEVAVARCAVDLTEAGALLRAAQMAGALDGALELSIEHANQRVQFGKPLGKFQAVQQALAVLAEEAGAVNCAAQAAALAADRGEFGWEAASAKLRANMAVEQGTAIAHQVHGAIGFTGEHGLHLLTRRLMAWRSEFGNDRAWAERLGRQVAAIGAAKFWAELTRRSDLG